MGSLGQPQSRARAWVKLGRRVLGRGAGPGDAGAGSAGWSWADRKGGGPAGREANWAAGRVVRGVSCGKGEGEGLGRFGLVGLGFTFSISFSSLLFQLTQTKAI